MQKQGSQMPGVEQFSPLEGFFQHGNELNIFESYEQRRRMPRTLWLLREQVNKPAVVFIDEIDALGAV